MAYKLKRRNEIKEESTTCSLISKMHADKYYPNKESVIATIAFNYTGSTFAFTMALKPVIQLNKKQANVSEFLCSGITLSATLFILPIEILLSIVLRHSQLSWNQLDFVLQILLSFSLQNNPLDALKHYLHLPIDAKNFSTKTCPVNACCSSIYICVTCYSQ